MRLLASAYTLSHHTSCPMLGGRCLVSQMRKLRPGEDQTLSSHTDGEGHAVCGRKASAPHPHPVPPRLQG